MTSILPPPVVYELRRSRAARSTKWLLLLVVVTGAMAGSQSLASDTTNPLMSGAAGHAAQVGPIAALLGALAIGPEFRWSTIRQVFTAFPRRFDILAAKVGVAAVLVAAASFVASILGGAISFSHRAAGESVLDWLGISARAALVLIGWVIIGFALAALAKSTLVGVAVPLVFAFLVEIVIVQASGSDVVASLLPFYNANESVSATASVGEAYLHLGGFGIWVLLILGIAFLVLDRRDA
jgi:ABC-type transport system involved in multi-copper enzyme maturation permease subunit